NRVLDAGINFIDTANGYGESEARIGRCISHRRDEFFLATKCGLEVVNKGDHDETPRNWTRAHLMKTIDESLVRMKTDHLDLLQLHGPTVEDYDRYEVGRILEDARAAGKTRFIGVSTTLPHLPYYLELGVFDTFQIPYSALEREHETWISRAAQSGAGTIIRGGVAKGAPVKPDSAGSNQWEDAHLDDLLDGMSRMEFILRFTLSHPHAHTTIVATINPDHLAHNLAAAARGALSPGVYAEAKRRLASPADTSIS
ncbi:MAG: aldo/keto reductase, partial [Anaerolineae bacterium]|nr:aldo/keto reductase [Anaerolineae bacterium]